MIFQDKAWKLRFYFNMLNFVLFLFDASFSFTCQRPSELELLVIRTPLTCQRSTIYVYLSLSCTNIVIATQGGCLSSIHFICCF